MFSQQEILLILQTCTEFIRSYLIDEKLRSFCELHLKVTFIYYNAALVAGLLKSLWPFFTARYFLSIIKGSYNCKIAL